MYIRYNDEKVKPLNKSKPAFDEFKETKSKKDDNTVQLIIRCGCACYLYEYLKEHPEFFEKDPYILILAFLLLVLFNSVVGKINK